MSKYMDGCGDQVVETSWNTIRVTAGVTGNDRLWSDR